MTTKTAKQKFTDEELIAAFAFERPGRSWRATFVPAGAPNEVPLWDQRMFSAANKAEAVRIAREYGERIIDMRMVYVYLAPKSGGSSWR